MSVLIQDLGQSGMGTPHVNCPSKPCASPAYPHRDPFPSRPGELLARLRLGARNDIRALLGNQ